MLSFWERRNFLTWDFAVVGGGIVGLSAALAIRRHAPDASVLVLERGLLPSGASTRNAGFACFGSPTELLADLAALGEQATVDLVARRVAGLHRLRERLGDATIDYRPCGGFELLRPGREDVLDALPRLDALLAQVLGPGAFVEGPAPADLGFAGMAHTVALPREGALDPGRVIRALQASAGATGIVLWTGARVDRLEPDDAGVSLDVAGVPLRAGRVAVCTNAFARDLLPDLDVVPGRGQVLVTEPVADLPWRGVFHLDEGYVYFRDVDGRVLLGGGRHLDFAGETTTEPGLTPRIQGFLEELLRDVLLPGRRVAIAHRWSGTMGFGRQKLPVVARIDERLAVGVRLGGMGVALGSLVGEEVAALLV